MAAAVSLFVSIVGLPASAAGVAIDVAILLGFAVSTLIGPRADRVLKR